MKKLLAIDGNAYIHRAYHGMPKITREDGFPIGAITGVRNMTQELFRCFEPSHCIVVFDHRDGSFRNKLYPEYKATRKPSDEDLKKQYQPIYDLFKSLGITTAIIPDYEADDVLGSIANIASSNGLYTMIATGDKDMAQLVDEYTHLVSVSRGEPNVMDEMDVLDKFGVMPYQMIDYLTLVGDQADNVKGVYKCGPKTAVKWLLEYETLDNLILNKDEIKGAIGDRFRESLGWLPLSKNLVTIRTDVSLGINLSEMSVLNIKERLSFIEEYYNLYELKGEASKWLDLV